MLRQRIFGILAGYEDCNDHDTLRHDPILKMAADRLPEEYPRHTRGGRQTFRQLALVAFLPAGRRAFQRLSLHCLNPSQPDRPMGVSGPLSTTVRKHHKHHQHITTSAIVHVYERPRCP